MPREFRVPYDELADPQTITDVNKRKWAEQFDGDLESIHKREVTERGIEDDDRLRQRVYRVSTKKYFLVKGTKPSQP